VRDASGDRGATEAGANCAGMALSFPNSAGGAALDLATRSRVQVNFGTSGDLPVGNSNRTIEFWAYVLTSSWGVDTNTIFEYGTQAQNATGNNSGFGLDFDVPGVLDPYTNGSLDNPAVQSGLNPAINQWAHFAMSWDGTAARLFVNGVERGTQVAPVGNMMATVLTQLTIGCNNPRFACFNGQIDEFRVWNMARTAVQITSTMNHPLMGNEPGLTGYWKFDETTGTSAADSTNTVGHTPHPGVLMSAGNQIPVWIASTAPITCL
jgi:hypothetical protein